MVQQAEMSGGEEDRFLEMVSFGPLLQSARLQGGAHHATSELTVIQ